MLEPYLRRNREALNRDTVGRARRRYLSPATYVADRVLAPVIRNYARGALIDVGCGDMPYRGLASAQVERYDSLDVECRVSGVTYLGDAQDMRMIDNDTYDTALCLSVLEHLPDPHRAVREMHRVLKEDGLLIVSVPHLSRLHEEPHDYYRFTRHGLREMVEKAGFTVVELVASGGLFAFLGHQFSTVWLCSVWGIPVVREIAFLLNKILCVWPAYFLDRMTDRGKIFALGYVCVARKGDSGSQTGARLSRA